MIAEATEAHGPASGLAAEKRPVSLRPLTTAEAVHNLTPAQANVHYPVHLRAVCIVCFTGWHGFSPAWWTPAHALLLLTVALAVTLVLLVWGVTLRRRVEQQTVLLRQQADVLRENEERIRHMALHDSLTGLATRLLLQDRLGIVVEAAKRNQTGLALLMVDLDKFKEVNDTFGRHAGDEVLRVTAKRIQDAVRKADTVARVSGDEFVVLLPAFGDRQAAETVAESLIASLSVPIPFFSYSVPVTVSIGIYICSAEELDAEKLFENADIALSRAQERGRSCFEVLGPEGVAPQ